MEFLRRRLLPLLTTYYVANLAFLVVRIAMGEEITGINWFGYITTLKMPDTNAWYVIAASIFYVVFYLAFRKLHDEKKSMKVIAVATLIYMLIGSCMNHNGWWLQGEWWYNTVPCLWLGLVFASREEQIVAMVKKNYRKYLLVGLLLALITYQLAYIAINSVSYYGEDWNDPYTIIRRWICLLVQVPAAVMFVAVVLLISMKLKLNNRVLKFMGQMTLEVYLVHGIFIELFGYNFYNVAPSLYYIRNVFLFVIAVAFCSIISAIILKWCNKHILRVITYTTNNNKKVKTNG